MTVYIASLFLPYTIDFKAAEFRHARRKSSKSLSPAADRRAVVGRLAESRREPSERLLSLSLTPGATTDDEKIFKPYASRSAGEISGADDPKGPVPSEPRVVSWGQSRKFNQPKPLVAPHPEPSILGRFEPHQGNGNGAVNGSQLYMDGASDRRNSEGGGGGGGGGQSSPRAFLSDVDWVVKAAEQGNGGLRNAIDAAVEAGLIPDPVWVGTLGMPTDSLKDETRAHIAEKLEDQFASLTVFVRDAEFVGHYNQFCRTILWPALHYQMQESPRHTEYDDYSWKQYLKVNEAFAKIIAAHWRPGDSIWIHDYHLLLLPSLLREKLPHAEIGFFMHAAFPSSEVFRCLTARTSLLHGLLGADLVGFQTEEYCHHFLHTCSRLLSLEVSADGVQTHNRNVHIRKLPFGIDPKALDDLRQTFEVQEWISNISHRYQGKHLIVARDRLDGPGGIKQKLLAYELFLTQYPKWRESVVLIQVASSASEIPELEAQVSKIAMRINSTYSTLTHQPLVFLRQDISYSQFLALMSVAEVFMVTSLREGMNLTSHDFLNCQDGRLVPQRRYGSLILSEFTGSASIFSGYGLLVNPWDYQQCADAINRALEMTPRERMKNWQTLMAQKEPYTATAWCASFRKALSAAHSAQLSREPSQLSTLSVHALKESYAAAKYRLFFLEDEGIFASSSSSSSSSDGGVAFKKAIAQLKLLLQDPRNLVYVTSSKSPEQLETYLSELLLSSSSSSSSSSVNAPTAVPAIGLIGENGCFVRDIGTTQWESLLDVDATHEWRQGIRKVIQYFQERIDGSSIEERHSTLTFRYDGAQDAEIASRQASELADQIASSRGSEAIRVVLTDGAVSIEPLNVTKATAAEWVLRRLQQSQSQQPPELFVFVAGGSRSDEALFHWANQLLLDNQAASVTTLTTSGLHATEAKAILVDGTTCTNVLSALHST